MIYAQPQGEHAVSELQGLLKKASDAKWYRRLKIVQLSMTGMSVPQLSQHFEVCKATIRKYIKAYNQGGVEALIPKKPTGRLPKVAHLTQDDWNQILRQTPDQYEKLQTDSRQWTLALLVGYAKEYLDQEVCFQTVAAALKHCKFRTGRSKLRVGSPDPDYQVKRERVEQLRSFATAGQLTSIQRELVAPQLASMIVVPKRKARLFFFDETDIHWCPDTGRTYQLPKQQLKVHSLGQDTVRYLLGSVEYPSGEGLYELYPRKRNEEVQQHLEHLLEMFPNEFCFVVWDNASSHTTPMLWPFLLEQQEYLAMVELPTYSPHLNLIERLWRFMRDQRTRNQFYPSFQELCEGLVGWLKRLPFERFQSLMGIQQENQIKAQLPLA